VPVNASTQLAPKPFPGLPVITPAVPIKPDPDTPPPTAVCTPAASGYYTTWLSLDQVELHLGFIASLFSAARATAAFVPPQVYPVNIPCGVAGTN
jgi:hypothetical protein